MTFTFIAKFRGRCDECGQGIEVGDECVYHPGPDSTQGGDRVIHVTCPPSLDDIDLAREVCGTCWLVKPCDCEGA